MLLVFLVFANIGRVFMDYKFFSKKIKEECLYVIEKE